MEQGVIKSEIIMGSDDQLHHLQTQPAEDLILNRNAELRKNPGVIRDLGAQGSGGTWGRQVASIPEIMYHAAIRNQEVFRWRLLQIHQVFADLMLFLLPFLWVLSR